MNRVDLARLMIRIGRFIQSLSIMVMRPEDLVKFGRRMYSTEDSVKNWSKENLLANGLVEEEEDLLKHIPVKGGSILLLGIGGGREAIALGKKGFSITGVDFVPDMVNSAVNNARCKGIEIQGTAQEISKVGFQSNSFDIVWLSSAMYSCIPTRKRRIAMLERIHEVLRPEGVFLCQFFWSNNPGFSDKADKVRKLVAFFSLGYREYEKGDLLRGNSEFIHAFSDEESLVSELREGGFEVIKTTIFKNGFFGGAILKMANGKEID